MNEHIRVVHRIVCVEALCSFSSSHARIHTHAHAHRLTLGIKAQLSYLCDRADENGNTKEELDICFALFVKCQERRVLRNSLWEMLTTAKSFLVYHSHVYM